MSGFPKEEQEWTLQKRNNQALLFDSKWSPNTCLSEFFLNTLGISEQTARTALSKMTQAGTVEAEKRGGQSVKVTLRNNSIKEEVMTHINRFPRVESHFCRATTTKEYLSSDLTVQKMYAMFCKERDQNDSKPPSFRFYYNTFKEMNLSIH